MNLNERFDVSEGKLSALCAKIERLKIDLSLVEESFIRGSGKGGQKINKTSNRVVLSYAPLGLTVRCQKERRRTVNRFLALRELVEQIESRLSPETSQRTREIARLKKRKARRQARSASKHNHFSMTPVDS